MAEFTDRKPSLLTYLGLGLLQSSQRGPKQNLGYNLLNSLSMYGDARAQDQQLQLRQQEAERQQKEAEQRQKLFEQATLKQQQEQDSISRIRTLIGPRSEYVTQEPPGTPEERRQAAQLEYVTNVDPKAMGGLLGVGDTQKSPNFGLTLGYAQDDQGNVIAVQPSSAGGDPNLLKLPPKFRWMLGQTPVNLGDRTEAIPTKGIPGLQKPMARGVSPENQPAHKGAVAKASAEGSELGKQIAGVEGDVSGLDAIRSARGLLDKGIYTGFYANAMKAVAKATPGMDKEKAARTEEFTSHIGNIVIPRLKEFGGSDTVEEMNYLLRIMAGEITMEEGALRNILESAEAKVQRRIERLKAGGQNGTTGRPPIADFFR